MSYKTDLLADLKDREYCAKYLEAAIADSVGSFLVALRDVAESQKGMTRLASAAGVNRENLYRMLSGRGNPRLNNFKAVMDAIGLEIQFAPAAKSSSALPLNDFGKRNATDVPLSPMSGSTIQGTQARHVGFFNTHTGFITIPELDFGQQQGGSRLGMPILSESGTVSERFGTAQDMIPALLNQIGPTPLAVLPYLK